MALRLEDYALIGDMQSAALVGNDGSIDWLCWPRFDSDACFAALLGTKDNGRWLLAPAGGVRKVSRQYRNGSLVLQTDFETEDGAVRVIDFMPIRGREPDLVRIVEGVSGRVPMHLELKARFGYGCRKPWVRRFNGDRSQMAGPEMLQLHTEVPITDLEADGWTAGFSVEPGQRIPFLLAWHPSYHEPARPISPLPALDETEGWWREWSAHSKQACVGPFRDEMRSSLRILKALTYSPTGGMVAAPTTSLPEAIGGIRNWDYRYCWVRDATLTLIALLDAGYRSEAAEWRDWLLRAVAGEPAELQIMYGVAGERRLTELELPWLNGYESSRPVRIGNAASQQLQLDIYGEVMDCFHQARVLGLDPAKDAWRVQKHFMDWLESNWQEPDEGIWEVRGPRRHFTHSKVMAWVAMDRAVASATQFGLEGPVDRWRGLRDEIHRQVCEKGFNAQKNAFTQSYGDPQLDASLLMMPLVGFLPHTDLRVTGTIEAIRRELVHDGFVYRYDSRSAPDGLPPGEGVFLPCSFWLADCYSLLGRHEDAERLFRKLLSLRNDVGLLSEEYDVRGKRLIGNFPQAFSHLSIVGCALNLASARGKTHHRRAHISAPEQLSAEGEGAQHA